MALFIFPLTLFFIYDIYIFYESDNNRTDSGNNELILKYRIDMKYLMNFQSAWRPPGAAACLLIFNRISPDPLSISHFSLPKYFNTMEVTLNMMKHLLIFSFSFILVTFTVWGEDKKKGIWGTPERAPFDSKFYEGDFTFSADGKTLFFSSKRPSEISKPPLKESDIWEVKKTASGWSTPRPLHFPMCVV
jgi:hypothetical protein